MNNLEKYKKYIGKYIRNQFGIAKVIDVFEERDTIYLKFDRNIVFDVHRETLEITDKYLRNVYPITEYTHNLDERIKDLFDIIEVGDIVDGNRVTEKDDNYMELAEGEYCYWRDDYIKTVITKEMAEKIQYRVEE